VETICLPHIAPGNMFLATKVAAGSAITATSSTFTVATYSRRVRAAVVTQSGPTSAHKTAVE
jgi:hypothetical protein